MDSFDKKVLNLNSFDFCKIFFYWSISLIYIKLLLHLGQIFIYWEKSLIFKRVKVNKNMTLWKILSISTKKDSGLVVSWSLVKKIGESLGLVKLRLARKLQSLISTYQFTYHLFGLNPIEQKFTFLRQILRILIQISQGVISLFSKKLQGSILI